MYEIHNNYISEVCPFLWINSCVTPLHELRCAEISHAAFQLYIRG